MSNKKANTITCPHCQRRTGQLQQEHGIIFCVHCENTYLKDDDDDQDQEDASDDIEDDDEEDEFVLLPPRDTEFDALSDTDTKSTSKTKSTRAKPKEKKPITPKRKRNKQTASTRATTKVSTKLPSIFSDAILSTVQRKRDDAYSDDDELAFSDLSDQEGVNDSHDTLADQQSYSRKAKRAKRITFSDSDTDDEEEIITVFKKGRKGPRATKEHAKSTTIKAAMPLKQYSTFAQFNKEMRAKLAKEYQEAIKDSGEPQKHLSRLVADAWKAMPKTEKDEFKQKLKGERELIRSTVKQKKPQRPSGNGYILYSQTKLPQIKVDYPQHTTARELSAIVSQHWKALDDNEREAYKAKAKQEREDWIKENPELHQQYMDKMTSKIRATKKARRGD